MRPDGSVTRVVAPWCDAGLPGSPDRFQPVSTVNTVPPGLTVSCRPEAWRLAKITTVTWSPDRSVPLDGWTITKPEPFDTAIDQLTDPPCAVSVMLAPNGETCSCPPAGLTVSVPAVGDGAVVGVTVGAGVGLAVVGVGEGSRVGDAVGVGGPAVPPAGPCPDAEGAGLRVRVARGGAGRLWPGAANGVLPVAGALVTGAVGTEAGCVPSASGVVGAEVLVSATAIAATATAATTPTAATLRACRKLRGALSLPPDRSAASLVLDGLG